MVANRWQPWNQMWAEMDRLQQEMNRVFGRPSLNRAESTGIFPPVNVWQDSDNLYVEAELPGMNLEDLEIDVLGDQLTIKGKRTPPAVEKGNWHRQERGYTAFARTLTLPFRVNAEAVEAELRQGVLGIRLPRHEEAKPRRISVKVEQG